ncbi:hypothetical protein RB620_26140 [Paenibacillus sp. LHD-117]|uniref:DUF6916 family protein n=1 Tax=Paenibacillus sp. LHD-117 TaxID=3071412 RepID=UPI0027E1581B|nr:hypothetical protein [Paenibacillus sp. LHD-117]MDQ6422913.1 hypothetical protein [Paenibacillus sp. LHD-117]
MASIKLQQYKEAAATRFAVKGVEPLLELVLEDVQDRGQASGYESFTLVFRGPRSPFIPQQLVPLEHAGLGPCDMFLVPVSQDAEGYRYEAVFNRLVEEE